MIPVLIDSLAPSSATASSDRKRILIVDDHPLIRRGMATLISDQADFEVCGEAENEKDATFIALNLVPTTQ